MFPEEHLAVQHFKDHHGRTDIGRFDAESHSQAVHSFCSLKQTLHAKDNVWRVIEECFENGHVKMAIIDMKKLNFPMHVVLSSMTTVRAKTLGVEFYAVSDHLQLNVVFLLSLNSVIKHF